MNYKIPISKPYLTSNAKDNLIACIDENWISSKGRFVEQFENDFAKLVGAKFAISVSNGTAALHLALLACGINPGDEVIVPDLTFAATINPIILVGAIPVLVDIDAETWNIDLDLLEKSINKNTKAIIPVHLYGNPAEMQRLKCIADKYNLIIIEDCAESLGAYVNSLHTGTIAEVGCFSFFANKLLTTGEGGMITTNDSLLAKKLKVIRDHGMSEQRKYWHEVVGLNYRLTNLQAAIGVSQLPLYDECVSDRSRIIARYKDNLSENGRIKFQKQYSNSTAINWLTSIIVNDISRDILINKLMAKGIESRPFFYPLHSMPPYENYSFISTGASIKISAQGISLPTYFGISNTDVDYISECILEILRVDCDV